MVSPGFTSRGSGSYVVPIRSGVPTTVSSLVITSVRPVSRTMPSGKATLVVRIFGPGEILQDRHRVAPPLRDRADQVERAGSDLRGSRGRS